MLRLSLRRLALAGGIGGGAIALLALSRLALQLVDRALQLTELIAMNQRYKVPALRNVSKTGPYFHDGRFKTLDEAVTFMFDFYRKKNDSKETLSDAEKRDIVAFLQTL